MSAYDTVTGYIADPLDLLGMRAGKDAAQQQLDAQGKALEQQKGVYDETTKRLGGMTEQGRQDLTSYNNQAADSLAQMYGQQQGYLDQAGDALGNSLGRARGALAGGYRLVAKTQDIEPVGDVMGLQGLRLGWDLEASRQELLIPLVHHGQDAGAVGVWGAEGDQAHS